MYFFDGLFRHSIYLIHFIFFILGNLLFCYSYDFLNNPLLEKNSTDEKIIYLCVLSSAILVIISLLGCYGTLFEKPYLRKSFVILILIFIVLQIFIIFMISRNNNSNFGYALKEQLFQRYDEVELEYQSFIDNLQNINKCCGVDSYLDYKKDTNKLPRSCFKPGTVRFCITTGVYNTGCLFAIEELYKKNKKKFLIILSSVLGIQFLTIAILFLLSKKFREKYNFLTYGFWTQN